VKCQFSVIFCATNQPKQKPTLTCMREIRKFISDILSYGNAQYRDLILGLLLGLFLAWIYHKYIGNRNLKTSYENLLKSKEETIDAYKEIIGGRLASVEVEKKDKEWFFRLKKFFRATPKFNP